MELPPKVVSREVIRREHGLAPHAGSADLGRTGDSLPVLGALSEFIETERRRSRNRTLILAAFFVLILIIVVGAGLFAGMLLFDQMQSNVDDMQSKVDRFQLQAELAQKETRTSLAKLDSEARGLLQNLGQQESALAATRSEIDSYKADYERELTDMKQLLSLLETENVSLKKDLQRVRTQWPKPAKAVEDLVVGTPLAASLRRDTTPTPPPEASRILAESFELAVLPVGGSRSVAWRLPIPE